MKKILITAVALMLCSLCLFSCAGNNGVPEGMQLAGGSAQLGYYFYVPEEWVVSSIGDISAAYASKVDSSSVSYVETAAPAVSEDEGILLHNRRKAATKEYFDNSMKDFPLGYTLTDKDCEAVVFGNASDAFKFVFDYNKIEENQGNSTEPTVHKFRCMQILVYFEDRFGIFTFTSPNEKRSSNELVQFDFYQEKCQAMIESFKFESKSEAPDETDNRVADEDGYLLSSDKTVAGLSLYLPKEFKLEFSSGMVAASLPDGSNFNVSKATATGVSVNDYWNYRKSELESLFGEVTVLSKNPDPEDEVNPYAIPTKMDGARFAFLYEYTYNALGETYRVYQIFAVAGPNDLFLSGFVFTYTAKADNYEKHLETILNILEKVEF